MTRRAVRLCLGSCLLLAVGLGLQGCEDPGGMDGGSGGGATGGGATGGGATGGGGTGGGATGGGGTGGGATGGGGTGGGAAACSASNCAGCCDSAGVCQPGLQAPAACGTAGAACTACPMGQVCAMGTCAMPDSGVMIPPQDVVLNVDVELSVNQQNLVPLSDGGVSVDLSLYNGLKMAIEEETDGGVIQVDGGHLRSIDVRLRVFNCLGPSGIDIKRIQDYVRTEVVANEPTIAYFGSYCGSQITQAILPTTNAADLLTLSISTYAGLTQTTEFPQEPYVYYPSGERNFARLQQSTYFQGRAAAKLMAQINATNDGGMATPKVYLVHNNIQPERGQVESARDNLADAGFSAALATASRINVVPVGITQTAIDTLVQDLITTQAEYLFIATGISGFQDAVNIVRTIRAEPMLDNLKIVVPNTTKITQSNTFITQVGAANSRNLFAQGNGLPPSAFTGPTLAWYNTYRAKYPTNQYNVYLPMYYDGMKVLLKSLKTLGDNADSRDAVRDSVLSTMNYSGALGTWSFDSNGDISTGLYSGFAANGTTTWTFTGPVVP
jgi:hypothetical protein